MNTPAGSEPEGAAVIRALFEAFNEGRHDDMLRLVDPSAVWEPATQPTRGFYLGKEGMIALATDVRSAYGECRVECHTFEALQDGSIRVVGSVFRTAPGADPPVVAFTTVVTLFEGRLRNIVTQPADLHADHGEPTGA